MDQGPNDMKRFVGAALLTAFLAGVATPGRAAFMRCGMAPPSSDSRCGFCDSDDPSVPTLTSGSCCSIEPARDREAVPAMTASAAPGPLALEKCAIAASRDFAGACPTGSFPGLTGASHATGPLRGPSYPTILRL